MYRQGSRPATATAAEKGRLAIGVARARVLGLACPPYLLVENGLRLAAESGLLPVITALALRVQGSLAGLVLGDLVGRVLAALGRLAERVAGLRNDNLEGRRVERASADPSPVVGGKWWGPGSRRGEREGRSGAHGLAPAADIAPCPVFPPDTESLSAHARLRSMARACGRVVTGTARTGDAP